MRVTPLWLHSLTSAVRRLQQILRLFSTRCKVNQLTKNIQKSKIIVLGSRHRVKKAKNISVKVDGAHLKWFPHISIYGLYARSYTDLQPTYIVAHSFRVT